MQNTPRLQSRLDAYLKQDRQWFRYQRIAYAKLMHKITMHNNETSEANFWLAVIQANGARL